MGKQSTSKAIAQQQPGVSRRDFLLKAAIGAAAAFGLGELLRRRLIGSSPEASNPLGLDEDSIFWPREDALRRMRGDR